MFIKWRVCYIENLNIMNLWGNQNVRYIKAIVNDWFLTQSGDFCGNTINAKVLMTYNKLLTEKLLSLDLFHTDFTIRICWLLICSAFVCCCVLNIHCVDIVIRYIEVDYTFRLPEYVCYIEESVILRFVISRFYSIHYCNFARDEVYRSLYWS